MNLWLPVLLAVASAGISLLVMGPPVAALCLAMLGGLVLYRHTFYRRMPAPEAVLPLYLGAVAWQLLHFVEEFATGFHRLLPPLVGAEAWSDERFLAFNMVHYALFLVPAIALVKGVRSLTYFAAFFLVVMFVNGAGHPALALLVGGYFPGLWTGLASPVWAALILVRLRAPARERAGA